jgi:hypothetical protein
VADTLKVLGQSNPAATTLTDVYTVPGATSTTVSTVTVCNQGIAGTFRLSVAIAGAADTPAQYIYHDLSIPPDETFACTFGITLATTDVLRAWCSHANMSVNVFGVEVA